MAGYFQGKKRGAVICNEDGTTSRWRPPAKRSRANATDAPPARATKPIGVRDQRVGMTFIPAADFIADPSQIPNGPGVYALFFRRGTELLAQSELPPDQMERVWRRDGHDHLYTGESYGLRGRLQEHLTGDIRFSNLRETLLALQWCGSALPSGPEVTNDGAATEAGLTGWLASEVMIGFKNCGYVRDVEAALLRQTASPLNIQGRGADTYAVGLKAMRARFHSEVAAGWASGSAGADITVRRR
jgi:hypothetical protein